MEAGWSDAVQHRRASHRECAGTDKSQGFVRQVATMYD